MEITSLHIKSGIILTIALIFIVLKKNSYVKGWFGELAVNLLARLFLDKKKYHLIKNVTLPTEDSTTQIDHIIVSRFGIFLVETKNMKGLIYGSEDSGEWTQQIYSRKIQFQNPLRQNYQHTKVLEEILGLRPNRIFSIIVFVGESTFKTEMPDNVTVARGYIDYIKTKQEPLFGEYEVQEIIEKIKAYRLDPGLETRRAQVRNLEKKYPRKIRQKLSRAKPTSAVYKIAVIAAALLILVGVAKKTFIDQPGDGSEAEVTVPFDQREKTPEQRELNKIYQYKDTQGRTRYTNVATTPGAKLVDENAKSMSKSLPIEISGSNILIPVTFGNKGTEMQTKLVFDQGSPITILAIPTADLIGAENLGAAAVTTSKGKTVRGEKRKVDYFLIGDVVEPDFLFLAVAKTAGSDNKGILGMDFMSKHPFDIDAQNKILIFK